MPMSTQALTDNAARFQKDKPLVNLMEKPGEKMKEKQGMVKAMKKTG